jgi:hypothetical protein
VSVIIYGVRPYGVVDARGGEYAHTSFFHLWFVPLIPTSSFWVTNETMEGCAGYPIDMHGKSVLAGYFRVWGPVVALASFGAGVAGHPLMLLISALAIALTVWTWTWRSVRGEEALRRSDFNLVSFGTRCEPHRLADEQLASFKAALDHRWNELKPDRTPNDVARHGTKNANEAITAYGLLRVAAATRGRAGREEDADADRILDGAQSTLASGEGPYREGVQEPTITGSLAMIVKAMAAAQQMLVETSPQMRAQRLAKQKRRSRWQALGLALATPMAFSGVLMFVDALRPTRTVTLKELRAMSPPIGRTVRVTCDAVQAPVFEEIGRSGETKHRITMCELGNYLLPVKLDAGDNVPSATVVGELLRVHDRLTWVRDGLSHEPELEVRTLDVFVDASDPNEKLFIGIFGLGIALALPVLWVMWFRARRRRKAEQAAT